MHFCRVIGQADVKSQTAGQVITASGRLPYPVSLAHELLSKVLGEMYGPKGHVLTHNPPLVQLLIAITEESRYPIIDVPMIPANYPMPLFQAKKKRKVHNGQSQ